MRSWQAFRASLLSTRKMLNICIRHARAVFIRVEPLTEHGKSA